MVVFFNSDDHPTTTAILGVGLKRFSVGDMLVAHLRAGWGNSSLTGMVDDSRLISHAHAHAVASTRRVGGECAGQWMIVFSSLGRRYGSRAPTGTPLRQSAFAAGSTTAVSSREKKRRKRLLSTEFLLCSTGSWHDECDQTMHCRFCALRIAGFIPVPCTVSTLLFFTLARLPVVMVPRLCRVHDSGTTIKPLFVGQMPVANSGAIATNRVSRVVRLLKSTYDRSGFRKRKMRRKSVIAEIHARLGVQ